VAESGGFEGPLAEFAALRQEIDIKSTGQSQTLTFQLTLAAAVFGFAVSRPSLSGLLLIIPIGSYLLFCRVVTQHDATKLAARYIREELSDRVPGGLGREQWLLANVPRRQLLGLAPLLLAFPGTSALALGWSFGLVFFQTDLSSAARVGLIIVWLVGLAAMLQSAILLARRRGGLITWPRN